MVEGVTAAAETLSGTGNILGVGYGISAPDGAKGFGPP
jgi:hypothetical protein